jgi:uncharacterized protein (DUF302 family)
MTYGTSVTVDRPYAETVSLVRDALARQGFGVLTEIDVAATLATKLGVTVAPQVILGACNPPLAHRALQAEESVGLLLPCNVVVRAVEDDRTTVEALDPQVMVGVTGNEALEDVAKEAATKLATALSTLVN